MFGDSGLGLIIILESTLPETKFAPENQWLEDVFPFGMCCVSFRESTDDKGDSYGIIGIIL